MSNVLFVLSSLYPRPSANGNCVKKISDELIRRNHNVFCICHEQTEKKDVVIDGIKIFFVDNYPQAIMDIKCQSADRKLIRLCYKFNTHFIAYIGSLLTVKSFPVTNWMVGKYYRKIEEICKICNIDIIVAVNKPVDAVLAATLYREYHPEIKLVSYLLDPIEGGYYNPLLRRKWIKRKCRKIEYDIIEKSDVIVVLDEHKSHYIAEYKDSNKMNYLGVPLLEDRTDDGVKGNKDYIVVYAGFVDSKIRDPQFIIKTFKFIHNARLIMYITNGIEYARKLARGIDNIEICHRVSQNELKRIYEDADAFLNIGNSTANQSPSKLIEFIGYGKKVISTYRINGDTSTAILKDYANALCVDEKDGDYVGTAKKIEQFMNQSDTIQDYKVIRKKYARYTPEAFINAINFHLEEVL